MKNKLTFKDLKQSVKDCVLPIFAPYVSDYDGKPSELRVYYICNKFVVMSAHEGNGNWECEGDYYMGEFEGFLDDFDLRLEK